MTGTVLPRSHGFPIDHIAIAAPDTEAAVDWFRDKIGAEPFITEPEPGQWYWSAALAVGDDSFVELLGPNPAHKGFNPIKQIISAFDDPQLLFWYVATDNFDAFASRAAAAGAALERIESVYHERNGHRIAYKRGILGPGFESQRACVIEWFHPGEYGGKDQRARIAGFELSHPKADAMNAVYRQLGIDITVAKGPSMMGLTLEGPNGTVEIKNPGQSFSGIPALMRMAGLYVGYLLKR